LRAGQRGTLEAGHPKEQEGRLKERREDVKRRAKEKQTPNKRSEST
jgi:hypothetical protein